MRSLTRSLGWRGTPTLQTGAILNASPTSVASRSLTAKKFLCVEILRSHRAFCASPGSSQQVDRTFSSFFSDAHERMRYSEVSREPDDENRQERRWLPGDQPTASIRLMLSIHLGPLASEIGTVHPGAKHHVSCCTSEMLTLRPDLGHLCTPPDIDAELCLTWLPRVAMHSQPIIHAACFNVIDDDCNAPPGIIQQLLVEPGVVVGSIALHEASSLARLRRRGASRHFALERKSD